MAGWPGGWPGGWLVFTEIKDRFEPINKINKLGTGHDWPWVSGLRFNMAKNVGYCHGKYV